MTLPESRRSRAALAAGLAALLALGWCDGYRPWEARYLGRPTSWWAREYGGLVWEYQSLRLPENPPLSYAAPPREPAWWEQWLRRAGVRLPRHPVDERLLQGDRGAVPVLVELLRRPEYPSRMAAAYGLARAGCDAREAVPHLLAALSGGDFTAVLARYALRRIDPAALAAFGREHPGAGREGE